jgi:large subunit ribosomal protein L25
MFDLKAKIRQEFGRKTESLRNKGLIPAVLYGPEIENLPLKVDLKDFEKVYQETGGSSLFTLKLLSEDGAKKIKEFLVLIHQVKKHPLTGKLIHIDFYQPILSEEVEASVPLVFEGEAPAVKDLGGTLIKEIKEVTVRALPQNLPREIKVDISRLKTFEDEILVKDLKIAENVKIQREPEEIVALAAPPEKVEEELKQPAAEEEGKRGEEPKESTEKETEEEKEN